MRRVDGLRVAVGGFMHETNTFQQEPTTMRDFVEVSDRPPLTRGVEVLTRFEGMNTPIAGAISVLAQAGMNLIPLPWCAATPSGCVTEEAYESISTMLLDDVRAALPLDAIFLSLHGAMVAQHLQDADGELLARLRALAGAQLPIVVSLDMHSNTSRQMFSHSDAMIGYSTYPHVDMAETGRKAARLLIEMLARGTKPCKAFRQIPYLIPLPWQCTSSEPAKSICVAASRTTSEEVASVSFMSGFPAADVHDCGPSVVAYGWDRTSVDGAAQHLERMLLDAESAFTGRLWAPGDAVREAMRCAASDPRPVLLADVQDNPGAGGSSDTVGLLRALLDHAVPDAVLGVLHDEGAARAALHAGLGAEITLGIGAKLGGFGEEPVVAKWRVAGLGDGRMVCNGPVMSGFRISLGPMACLRSGGVSVVVSSRKVQAMDEELFRHVGIDPREKKIVALKSTVHFRAAFEPHAQTVLCVESPGAMSVDPSRLAFHRLRGGVRRTPLREA